MADVIAAQQIIRRIVWLEVGHDGPLDAFGEKRFVAVEEAVRLSLRSQLQNGFAHSVHRVGRKDIVMVGKGQIFAVGQRGSRVGVGCNAPVFDFFVYDALIFRLIFLNDTFYIGMFRVGSIGKAELAVWGRLVHEGIQKFPQIFFRRIIQRGENADGGQATGLCRLSGHFFPLGFQHLLAGR